MREESRGVQGDIREKSVGSTGGGVIFATWKSIGSDMARCLSIVVSPLYIMSTSSATTLISPTASTLTNITSSSRPQVQHAASGSSQSIERMQTTGEASASASRPSGSGPVGASVVRRTSSNQGQPHAHGTGHHAVHKRRQGSHSHATHHAHGHGHGQARRSSEGEHGRRAMAAGLAMQSMQPPKARRKGSGDVSDRYLSLLAPLTISRNHSEPTVDQKPISPAFPG